MEDKFKQFLAQFNTKSVEVVDVSNLNGYNLAQLFDLYYNMDMKKFIIRSKKHGLFEVLLDDADYETIKSMGKWNIHMVRGQPYIQKRIKVKQLIQLYRFLLGATKGEYVDHINGNTLDNRRCNLRLCSNGANLRNGKIRPNNTSGYTGISFMKNQPIKPWHAQIRVNYKVIGLGSYKTFEEAVQVRKNAEIKYFNI